MNAQRAVLLIDGNNWYHGTRKAGVKFLGELDYRRISEKLTHPRIWVETRYYVGRVSQTENTQLYADQRRFLDRICKQDQRISAHFGRLEPRQSKNEAAEEMLAFLGNLKTRIDGAVYRELVRIATSHRQATVMVEKAVDVMIAVDLVAMAHQDKFDVAYLLTADGDFTPAVSLVQSLGKKVFAVSAQNGAELARQVDAFIPLKADWFDDCFAV